MSYDMKCPKCGERGLIKFDERGVFFCAACMWERDRKPVVVRPAGVVKIGRNDPCPCGSGKKFKKCCLPNSAIRLKPDNKATA